MVELTRPSRRTLIISISAVVGIAAISSLAYLYIRDNKRSTHSRQFRSLQRNLYSKLLKAQDNLDDLVENDLRFIQVRVKTLRTHPLYPGDNHVQLPSLGLINQQDKNGLGTDLLDETKEEMVREHTAGFEDHARVRQGYKELDLLVKSLHKHLVKLLEKVDGVDLSELAELGDDVVVASIHEFERLEGMGIEPNDNVVPTVDSEMMKQGVTFADMTKANIEEPEILAPTEDLERMKQGVTFAEVVAENLPEETGATEVLKPTEDLKKMKEGVTFADVVAENSEEHGQEALAPTKDLELMKQGVSFAEIAKHNIEAPSDKSNGVLAPTHDLEEMKQGETFADAAAEE
ncbi:hypothetical protein BGZ65_009392 [Modicella reniformis]|uniref:Uncharacterized protein n=1 Tax=Modicella reniformis TaxID=1440133 RepID=A0A9P6J7K3_9FUNG|nr:hypothetical protein BGZ65_009392 [Modicella reniformis]